MLTLKSARKLLAIIADTVTVTLVPGYCQLCQAPSVKPLCCDCYNELPRQDNILQNCSICDIALDGKQKLSGTPLCKQCREHPPSFDKVICAFSFEFPLSTLINRIKHQRQSYWLAILTDALVIRIEQYYQGSYPEVLMPMPIHWRRRFSRGFNQTELIANALAQKIPITISDDIKKHQHTKPQQKLSRDERMTNLLGCFTVNADVENKQVVIVDDVVTTGTSVDYLAQVLKAHGAKSVDVWALARTPSAYSGRQ
ncbi:MAG: hypothetical protein COA42_11490 [Alteromonadaceae bacterium]|nr:MAG: hypothetical protein COA42_11490 [Alteromonadaceae bacterium]